MADYSDYQKKVIRRYYDARDQQDEQRLAELVTNLYLATGEKKTAKLWEQARTMMTRMGVPASRVEHVVASADPKLLAEVVQDVQAGKIVKPAPVRKTEDRG